MDSDDFNRCQGRDCPDRDNCLRYLAEAGDFHWWDSYDLYRDEESCDWMTKPKYESYCGTCGHYMYYVPDKCPACGSSYIKKLKPKGPHKKHEQQEKKDEND